MFFFSKQPDVEAAPAPPPPSSVLTAASRANTPPLVRLVGDVLLPHVRRHARLYGGAAALLALSVALRIVSPRASGKNGGSDEDDKDVEFMDPAEHKFIAFLRKVDQKKKAQFLEVLEVLKDLVKKRDLHLAESGSSGASAAVASEQNGGTERPTLASDESDGVLASLNKSIAQRAIQADELLTQYIVSLDGLPVSNNPELKQRRKAIVKEAVSFGDLVTPHLKK